LKGIVAAGGVTPAIGCVNGELKVWGVCDRYGRTRMGRAVAAIDLVLHVLSPQQRLRGNRTGSLRISLHLPECIYEVHQQDYSNDYEKTSQQHEKYVENPFYMRECALLTYRGREGIICHRETEFINQVLSSV
jgi:hypothetical protein